jgi:octopine/nopaline transport system permease protein
MDLPFLLETFRKLLALVPMTLLLFVLSVSAGGVLALGLTWMRVSGVPVLDRLARGYVFVFRGTPLLIQMFMIYYGLSQFQIVRDSFLWTILRDPFNCAVISLALCTAAYTSEIFRGGLLAVPQQQLEAARACGMSGLVLLRRIVAPIALRQALPAYTTELVLMVKSTSLASLVGVLEITNVSQTMITRTYRTYSILLCAGLIYLVLNFIIVRIMAYIEYRLSSHLRARPESARPRPAIVG